MAPNEPMKLMAWNCRGLGETSTVSQLKEYIRFHLLDVIFLCETKQSRGFIGTVCKKLKFGNRWVASDPVGRKENELVAWKEHVNILSFWQNEFSIELQVEINGGKEAFWAVFVYASTDAMEKQE